MKFPEPEQAASSMLAGAQTVAPNITAGDLADQLERAIDYIRAIVRALRELDGEQFD